MLIGKRLGEESEAQNGDIAFFGNYGHIGIVMDGKIHSNSQQPIKMGLGCRFTNLWGACASTFFPGHKMIESFFFIPPSAIEFNPIHQYRVNAIYQLDSYTLVGWAYGDLGGEYSTGNTLYHNHEVLVCSGGYLDLGVSSEYVRLLFN